jgi:hypothetical protein
VSQDGNVCLSFEFSDGRDEYILKKYVEKRWVATMKIPEIPSAKVYRKQESKVIEFVSSGDLCQLRQGAKPFIKKYPLKLLRRGEEILEMEKHEDPVGPIEDIFQQSAANEGSSHVSETSADAIFDETLDGFPASFKYQIMSPFVVHSSQSSSATETASQISSAEPFSEMDSPSLFSEMSENRKEADCYITITVCDVGIQTD